MRKFSTGAYVKPKEGKFLKKNTPASVRITSGELRGRELKSPQSTATHPMGSRERLALFNSLGPELKDTIILDAFAGTGALGFEALSRGAAHATFIEKNHKAAEVIRSNIKDLGVEKSAQVIEAKVESVKLDIKYDVVFADPPYDLFNKVSVETLNNLAKMSKRYFILSHPDEFDPHVINLKIKSTRKYAAARISIFEA